MKFLHTSDLHINSPLTARLSGEKALIRRREINGSLRPLIFAAKELSIDAIVIAGDLFDGEEVSKRELLAVISEIENAADISFYYLPGNHEKNALKRALPKLPQNLFIFGDEWTYFDTGEAVLAGRVKTEENMFDTLTLSSEKKNIVVLHGEARTFSDAGGAIGLKEAVGKSINYLALGHYHKYSALPIDAAGVAVYSGTPEGRGFDECGDCGAVIVDTDSPYPYHRFIKTARRTLHSVEVSVDGAVSEGDIEAAVERATESIPSSDIVRSVLVGKTLCSASIDTDGILESVMSRFFYAELLNKTGILIRTEDYERDSTIRGELVRLVMNNGSYSESEREKIIATALAALDGEAYFGEKI